MHDNMPRHSDASSSDAREKKSRRRESAKLKGGISVIELAYKKQFDSVVKRAETHPKEASFQSTAGGTTPLHWLAYHNAPQHVVKFIAKLAPSTLNVQDKDGNTPLDIAIMYGAPSDVIKYLKGENLDTVKDVSEKIDFPPVDVEVLSQKIKTDTMDCDDVRSQVSDITKSTNEMIDITQEMLEDIERKNDDYKVENNIIDNEELPAQEIDNSALHTIIAKYQPELSARLFAVSDMCEKLSIENKQLRKQLEIDNAKKVHDSNFFSRTTGKIRCDLEELKQSTENKYARLAKDCFHTKTEGQDDLKKSMEKISAEVHRMRRHNSSFKSDTDGFDQRIATSEIGLRELRADFDDMYQENTELRSKLKDRLAAFVRIGEMSDTAKVEARLTQSEKSIEEIHESMKNLLRERDDKSKTPRTEISTWNGEKVTQSNIYKNIDNVDKLGINDLTLDVHGFKENTDTVGFERRSYIERNVSSGTDEKQILERQVSYLKTERVILLKFRDQPNFPASHLQDQIETVQAEQENLKRAVDDIVSSGNLQDRVIEQHCADLNFDGEKFDLVGETSQEKEKSGVDHFKVEKKDIEGKRRVVNGEVVKLHKIISQLKAENLVLLDYRHSAESERRRLWGAIQRLEQQQEDQSRGLRSSTQDAKSRELRSNMYDEHSRGLRSNTNSKQSSNEERTSRTSSATMARSLALVETENDFMDASTVGQEADDDNCYNKDFDARSICSMERKYKLNSIPRRTSGDGDYTQTSSVSNVSSFRDKVPDTTFRSRASEELRRPSNNLFDAHNVDLSKIAAALRSGVTLRDRTWRLYTYKDCFKASDAVDYIIKNGFVQSREHATTLCQSLQLICNLFEHITNKDYQFKDENVFLKFIERNERASLSLVKVKGYLDLDNIAAFVQSQVEVKDRLWHLRKFKNCFVGCELVDSLITKKIAQSREDAVRIGRALGTMCKLFKHVADEHVFSDEYLFFRFNRPTGTKFGTFYLSGSGWGGTSISWRSDAQGRMALELPPLQEDNVIMNMPT